jgi:hypothetical protein
MFLAYRISIGKMCSTCSLRGTILIDRMLGAKLTGRQREMEEGGVVT